MDGQIWRNSIVSQLRKRNKNETSAFQEIFTFQSRLFDNVHTLKQENLQLTLLNERIKYSTSDNVAAGSSGSNEKVQALEQRLLILQEELTTLYKNRGESAQQIMKLNARVHELESEMTNKDVIISENCALTASLRAEIQLYETNMAELQSLNQVIRDEHQALQIAFAALEDKLRKVQDENTALLDRLIKYKAKDADKMNEENENFLKSSPTAFLINAFGRVSFGKKGEKVRKELEEAARECGGRSSGGSGGSLAAEDKIIDSVPYYVTALSSKAAIKFNAHEGEVTAVKWSPSDKILATGGEDRKVKLWNISKGMCESPFATLVGSNSGIMSVDFDPKGSLIVGASNGFASHIWNISEQRMKIYSKLALTGHSNKVLAAKFLGESDKVISGSHDRTLKIWDLCRGGMCIDTRFVGSSCNDLVTSDAAGSTVISGHFDKSVKFWDLRNELPANKIDLQGKVTSLDLSRDCNYLLACVRDHPLELIDLRMNSIVRSFSHESLKLARDWTRAAFGPGGRLVSVGGADGSVFIWNTHSGRLETILKDHPDDETPPLNMASVTAVSWHPQSGLLASVDCAKRAIIYGDL